MQAKRVVFVAMAMTCWTMISGCAPEDGAEDFAYSAAVAFSVPGGDYRTDQLVALSSDRPEAVIYYTTDGTEPTVASGEKYRGAIPIEGHGTELEIRAIAAEAGRDPSASTASHYAIWYFHQAAPPSISPPAGTYSRDQVVRLATATEDADIRFTTDGSMPTQNSQRYDTPILLSGDGAAAEIRAIAYKKGVLASDVISGGIAVDYTALDPPTITPPPGTYAKDQSVTLSSSKAETIRFTVDGSAPTSTSPIYQEPIAIRGHDAAVTVRAVAYAKGMKRSSIAVADYGIAYVAAAAPSLYPTPGEYNGEQWITLSSADASANFHFTLDGSAPTTSSPRYTGPIYLVGPNTVELKAIAVRAGNTASAVRVGRYDLTYNVAGDVVMSPPAGTYDTEQWVTLSTSTPNAVIHYALEGPGSGGEKRFVYTGPIRVSGHGTVTSIRAQASGDGLIASPVTSSTYEIQWAQVAAPAIITELDDVDEEAPPAVSITSTPGASISYRLDDGPVWTAYTGPFVVSSSATVTARAKKEGMLASVSSSASIVVPRHLYVSANGDPENADGTRSHPYLSPVDAAADAATVGSHHVIHVAAGSYALEETMVLRAQTSLLGGYDDAADWSRDVTALETSLTATGATPSTLITIEADATVDTVVDGIAVHITNATGPHVGIDSVGGSPTISRTTVATDGGAEVIGMHSTGGSPSILRNHIIVRNAGDAVGILLEGDGAPFVYSNVIDTNGESAQHNYGIAFDDGCYGLLFNNTIRFGGAPTAVGIGSWWEATGFSAPSIDNNIVWSAGATGERSCVLHHAGHAPTSLFGNDLFDCPTALLRTTGDAAGDYATATAVNQHAYAAGNLDFDLVDGLDTFFVDEESDWRLRDAGSESFYAVKTGGISAGERFQDGATDYSGNERTGDDGSGWSIGAFENDM